MDIKNKQELAKIIALCRKNGVDSCKISSNSIEFTLGISPLKTKRASKVTIGEPNTPEQPSIEDLSPEDKLFWSSPNVPDDKAAS